MSWSTEIFVAAFAKLGIPKACCPVQGCAMMRDELAEEAQQLMQP